MIPTDKLDGVKKALLCMTQTSKVLCADCSYKTNGYQQYECLKQCAKDTLEILDYLEKENDDLFLKLQGVMHSVDKWLDGDELKQDEVNRAITMREKTLQITEKQQAEIERLREERDFYKAPSALLAKGIEEVKTEAINEFAEKLLENIKARRKAERTNFAKLRYGYCLLEIDNLVKEMTEVKV